MRHLGFAAALALAAGPAAAQEAYTTTTISVAQADVMMAAAVEEAEARQVRLAIVVVDEAGRIVLARRMDGAVPLAFELARRKAVTAALLRAPSRIAQERIAKGELALLAIDEMLPIQGGLPFIIDGRTIGAIGASGAPAAVDEAVVQAGLDALAARKVP